MKRFLSGVWTRVKPFLTLTALTNELEPARVVAAWTAIVAVGATVGITLPSHLSGQLVTALGLVDGLLPLLAGEVIRSKVIPTKRLEHTLDVLPSAEVTSDDGYDPANPTVAPPDGEPIPHDPRGMS